MGVCVDLRALRLLWLVTILAPCGSELLQSPGFESLDGWNCGSLSCTLSGDDRRSGQFAVVASGRTQPWMGPSQTVAVNCGQPSYQASGYVRLLSGPGQQSFKLTVDFTLEDGSHQYTTVDQRDDVDQSAGWIRLSGTFAPLDTPTDSARIYFSGPDPGSDFAVDDASLLAESCQCDGVSMTSEDVIEQIRKSDINFEVTTGPRINRSQVQIRVQQVGRAFPLGTTVSAPRYREDVADGKYRDTIHSLFNWAVLENSLKWRQVEWNRGQTNYEPALETINGLRDHGLQVRGHTLVWSVEKFIQDWVKDLEGQELRDVVEAHIVQKMNVTKGLLEHWDVNNKNLHRLEHWDVNNENVHGQWFQDQLDEPSYNLELFRIAHQADPSVKLFLNDYNVVAAGYSTDEYLEQALQVKAAYVGLYGLGAQCHFPAEQAPDPVLIKQRLDTLARAGLPIWVTELDVVAADEARRADHYELALRALFGHPAVEGILFWGFWDQSHWRGADAALFAGDDMQPTLAGETVLRLFQEEWMTNQTLALADTGDQFVVRGFHGDYQVRVYYRKRELKCKRTSFTLGKTSHTVRIEI